LPRSGMKLKIAWIGRTKEPAMQSLTAEYLKRISRYAEVEGLELRDESAVLNLAAGKSHSKLRHALVLLDPGGKPLSSEELADFVQDRMDRATPVLFAIGGADGFSAEARKGASFCLSLGKMTLPHELARVVLLEQLYRAFTILQGHPYHSAH
jgi:23S rRNA (pseudouridine1915-N3)-methyltransferase